MSSDLGSDRATSNAFVSAIKVAFTADEAIVITVREDKIILATSMTSVSALMEVLAGLIHDLLDVDSFTSELH